MTPNEREHLVEIRTAVKMSAQMILDAINNLLDDSRVEDEDGPTGPTCPDCNIELLNTTTMGEGSRYTCTACGNSFTEESS